MGAWFIGQGIEVNKKNGKQNYGTRKPTTHNYKDGSVFAPNLPQPTRLTPQQLEEKRENGICYSCDRKYIKGHKFAEKKLFYIGCEEEEEKEQEASKEEDTHQEQSRINESDDIL